MLQLQYKLPAFQGNEGAASYTAEEVDIALQKVRKVVKRVHECLQKKQDDEQTDESPMDSWDQHRIWLATTVDKLSSPDLTPEFAYKLRSSASITPDKDLVDMTERKRRKAFHQLKFRCVLRVQNKVITRSRIGDLNTSSIDGTILDIMQSFEFRVFNQPQNLSIDIFFSRGTLFNQNEIFAGTARISLPGRSIVFGESNQQTHFVSDSASAYAPVAGWYPFTIDADCMRKESVLSMLHHCPQLSATEVKPSLPLYCHRSSFKLFL